MSRLRFFSSSVGSKVLIGLTGLFLVLFLIVHLAGNLLIFVGEATFNGYSEKLISNPFVVPAEIGLVAIFLLHVYKTVRMWVQNRQTRPLAYEVKKWAGYTSRKSVGSTTMIYTGVVMLVFAVLHVKTFKYGAWYPYQMADGLEVRDLNRLVVEIFADPLYVGFYVVCMGLIGLHVSHGIASSFQSLGVDHPSVTPKVLAIGKVLAIVLAVGFAIIPLWVFFVGGRP